VSGHVRKLKSNYYIVLEINDNGKRSQKSLSVKKLMGPGKPAGAREARALLRNILKEYEDGTFIEPTDIKVGKYLLGWLEYIKSQVETKTYEIYRNMVVNHLIPELGDIKLPNLRKSHIKKMIADKLKGGRMDEKEGGLSPRSVQYMFSILKQALSQAVEDELIKKNVAEGVTPPKVKRPPIEYWSREEVQAFLSAISNYRLYPLYYTALKTGLRRGELLGLRWKDVSLEKKIITVRQSNVAIRGGSKLKTPKTASGFRTIEISDNLVKVLKSWGIRQKQEFLGEGRPEKDQGLVFTTKKGTKILPRNINRHFDLIAGRLSAELRDKKGKIIRGPVLHKISFHGLRHTFATLAVEEGIDMKTLAEILGHSNTAATDIYAHVTPRTRKAAAAATDGIF